MNTASKAADAEFMRRCLVLARRGEGKTSPNPMVGCVIVDNSGRVVAEGYHRRVGGLHAEADALKRAGGRAAGCTMYVNLEPCSHKLQRRTSPCAPRLLEAGIRRVVFGIGDPIRSHSGGGAWLAKAGVQVTRGVLRAECKELNRAFLTWAKLKRPYVIAKAATTLDGKIATRTGQSQWITGDAARRDVHFVRNRVDAILVGLGTVMADDPKLTVRGIRGARDPIRIVVDSGLRTPLSANILPANSSSSARLVIATTNRAPLSRQVRLEQAGAEVWRFGRSKTSVNLVQLTHRLAQEDVTIVLAEGGAALHASLMELELVDELLLYVAPIAFGGRGRSVAPSWLGGVGVKRIEQAPRFHFVDEPRLLGGDLLLTARRG